MPDWMCVCECVLVCRPSRLCIPYSAYVNEHFTRKHSICPCVCVCVCSNFRFVVIIFISSFEFVFLYCLHSLAIALIAQKKWAGYTLFPLHTPSHLSQCNRPGAASAPCCASVCLLWRRRHLRHAFRLQQERWGRRRWGDGAAATWMNHLRRANVGVISFMSVF